MPRYIIEITNENVMIGLPGDAPCGPHTITTRSRPFQTREAAEQIARVIAANSNRKTKVVCE